ncbi:MAG: hemolysin III family protein [Anaerovoracaceae bacterium]
MTIDPRDEWSFKTHFLGIILSIIATGYLVFSQRAEDPGRLITFGIFGISMIALYTCSSIYHYSKGSVEKIKRLRKLDHAMIYVLIAGTYTPILFNCLPSPKNIIFLSVIWALALAGIIMKVCWMGAPRWLSTVIYVVMGWAIVFDVRALMGLPKAFLWLLVGGGLAYTIGAVFYIFKKPNLFPGFGFHELFHVFILLGTALHFVGIGFYI